MKILKLITFPVLSLFVLAIVFLLSPELVLAQNPGAGAAGGFVPCSGSDCEFCHFIQLGNNILNWLFGIVFVIFGVIMVVAGFNLVTSGGNRSKLDDAKKKLSNALIGVLIMFAAYLLVDTLMRATLDEGFGPWNQISCDGGQTEYQPVAPGGGVGAGGGGGSELGENCTSNFDGTQTCTTYSDTPIDGQTCEPSQPPLLTGYTCTEVRPLGTTGGGSGSGDVRQCNAGGSCVAQLPDGSTIPVNRAQECPDGVRWQDSPYNCTSLNGVQDSTLSVVANMQSNCPTCNLIITAGSELGHTNSCHVNGTCVDLACSGGCSITQLIQANTAATANGSNIVYETLSCAARDAARAQGITAYCISDSGYGHISGDHFSLYTQ